MLDKWFAIQAMIPEAATIARIRRLQAHPAYAPTNPNRVRALIGTFSLANPTQFNRPDGAGFGLLAETASDLDGANPQLAARLLTAFSSWRQLEPARRAAAHAALERVHVREGLSRDVADIVGRSLSQAPAESA